MNKAQIEEMLASMLAKINQYDDGTATTKKKDLSVELVCRMLLEQMISLCDKDKRLGDEKRQQAPIFTALINITVLQLLFRTMNDVQITRLARRAGVPKFIQQNFCRPDGRMFSLSSLQRKNSATDSKLVEKTVALLELMIKHLKDNYY